MLWRELPSYRLRSSELDRDAGNREILAQQQQQQQQQQKSTAESMTGGESDRVSNRTESMVL